MNRRASATLLLALAISSCQLLSLPPSFFSTPTAAVRASPTAALPTPGASPTPWILPPTLTVQPNEDRLQEQAMLPRFAGDAAGDERTRYWIHVTVEFEPGTYRASIRGQTRMRYVVPHGPAIERIPLMLWPNDAQYAATMRVGQATIDGRETPGDADLGGIVQWYRLASAAQPGDALDISLPFEIDAGGPIGGVTPRRFGITQGVFIAPTFYPLIPRRVEGEWQVAAAPPGGDTTNSDTAFYDVDVTFPSGLSLAASGVETDRVVHDDGTETARFSSGPMRDFAFALGRLDPKERTVDGVVVRTWSLPEHADDVGAMLDAASKQLALLDDRVGSYPFAELDVVDAPGAFGGIEYPGLVFIGTLGSDWLVEPTVHEVAHQWFYSLIGDDQLYEPWLDESLASYAQVMYLEAYGGPGSAAGQIAAFRSWVRSAPDPTLPIGRPIAGYATEEEYWAIVYGKGPLFLDALRGELGDATFTRFLQTYFTTYRYDFITGRDFQGVAENTCECDLGPLFDLWVWQGGEIPGI